MNNYLFLFSIGPVQSFIAQARKTRDLYAGSQILSTLISSGIRAFKKEFPTGEIIFPYWTDKDSESLPNRFIAKLSAPEDELQNRGKVIQQVVENAWLEIAQKSHEYAEVDFTPQSKAQIECLLDIHWLFHEIKGGNYAKAYEELERLGGAVKNVRQFRQLEEVGRKCSIDGINNALFCSAKSNKNLKNLTTLGQKGFALLPGEGLSAVSLTKRFYRQESSFPSTAEVALMYDEKNLSERNRKRLECFKKLFLKERIVEACVEIMNNGFQEKISMVSHSEHSDWNDQFDYQMLYEENLNKDNVPNKQQLDLLKVLHKDLKKTLKTRYYAVVVFDGDEMGKWLSGKNNLKTDNLEDFHKTLSQALHKFAEDVRIYLDKSKGNGHVVYAGGDDFLGFINIHYLFEVMKHLRTRFNDKVNTAISNFKKPDKHITFSAGIVIAHYKMPFSEVLKMARNVEDLAKREGGRNAFGIAVMKHSGEIQQAIYKWDADKDSPQGCSNWEALEHICLSIDKESGDFSNTFIQNLTTEVAGIAGVDMQDFLAGRQLKELSAIIPLEIKRLVSRSYEERKKKDSKKIESLSSTVNRLWEHYPEDINYRPRNFIHALHIADFITRKIRQEL